MKTQHRCPSLKDTKLILLFTLCHIYISLYSLPACDAAPLCTELGACVYPTARLSGRQKGRCGSIVLSVFRRVSRQAYRRGRSRTVRRLKREMTVFPALAQTVDDEIKAMSFGRVSRAGGRGLSDGVEAEGLERFRLTRQYWLGRLRVNPAAATEELKPLERIGPARHGA